MLLQILSHTPLWVWAVLGAITTLGMTQLKARQVPRWRVMALPAVLLLLGLGSMGAGFRAHPAAAALWLGALVAMALAGQRMADRSGAVWLAGIQRLQLPGSPLPLVMALSIFCLRYVNGVATAMHPALTALPQWQWPLALIFGAMSGLFMGRALGLLRLAATPRTAATALGRPGTAAAQ
jgi:hypothetical protein